MVVGVGIVILGLCLSLFGFQFGTISSLEKRLVLSKNENRFMREELDAERDEGVVEALRATLMSTEEKGLFLEASIITLQSQLKDEVEGRQALLEQYQALVKQHRVSLETIQDLKTQRIRLFPNFKN